MDMRAPQWPTVSAFMQVVDGTSLGTKDAPANFDQAPDCPPPYLIVSLVHETVDGSMESPEADASLRIQLTAVGVSGEQATMLLDKTRALITKEAINAYLTNHKVTRVRLDSNRGTRREERGLPEALISKVDQYLVETRPGTP